MSKSQNRFFNLSAFLLIFVVIVCVRSADTMKSHAADANQTKLKQLLKDKLGLLQEIANQIDARHKAGFAGLEEVYDAHQAAEHARLDLCETNQERIAVMERMLAEAKQREAAVKQSAAVATHDVIKTQVDRLDIEIAMERLRSN